MRLYSKNLLMRKASNEYEVLDSLKVNQECFFLLDEFPISTTDIQVEMVSQLDQNSAGNMPRLWFGGTISNNTAFHAYAMHPTNRFRFYTGSINWETTTNQVSIYRKRRVVLKRNPDNTTTSSVLEFDGTVVYSTTKEVSFDSSSSPFSVFGNSNSVATFGGTFYSFKITQNGETVYDLVPARRIADGEFGLLNKADGKFYENQGTGTLERGEENA